MAPNDRLKTKATNSATAKELPVSILVHGLLPNFVKDCQCCYRVVVADLRFATLGHH